MSGVAGRFGEFVGVTVAAIALGGCSGSAAEQPYMALVDIVQCRGEYEAECAYYYERNWLVFRQEALERHYISGYRLLRSEADSTGDFTLLLVTEFPDSATFAAVEDNFQPMMRELRPDGADLLNSVPRSDFVANSTNLHARPLEGTGQ